MTDDVARNYVAHASVFQEARRGLDDLAFRGPGRRWLTELPKRTLRVRLRLNSLEEIQRWVLSMGDHATVVRPKALVGRTASLSGGMRELAATAATIATVVLIGRLVLRLRL